MERQTDLRGTRFPGLRQYPQLFSPLRLGNIRLKNRIIAAPTSPSMITAQGHFTPEMIAYLEEKARGGAAVVTYGEAIVHSATGKSHNKQLQLDAFGVRQGLAQAARAIHNGGENMEDSPALAGTWDAAPWPMAPARSKRRRARCGKCRRS